MTCRHQMTYEEILKLKAVVLYVISKCKELDYFHLFKILYFADKEHYAYYGRRIIKDTFCALPKGPVPSCLFDAIKNVTSDKPLTKKQADLKLISNSLFVSDPTYSFILGTKEEPDMDELSKSDIIFLDKSIEENKDKKFGDLSRESHDIAWQEAWNKQQSSPINEIMMAKAAGASQAMLHYIEENELIDSLIS